MSSSDLHLATTILDPFCVPQTQYQSKFYSKYSISCKENIIGMTLETMWSFHIEIRPHLAGHFRKEKNKDDRSTWSSRCSVQYSQEICSNETVAQKVTELQILEMWEKTQWKIFSISHGLLSKIGHRISRTFAVLWHIYLQTTKVSHAALSACVLSDTQALSTHVLLTTETSEYTCVLSQSALCPAIFLQHAPQAPHHHLTHVSISRSLP